MCLVTSTFYHKKDSNRNVKCFVAKEDILVYKCLDCTDGLMGIIRLWFGC